VLLNPGPATTTDSVKYAQVVPDICPREAEFGRLMKSAGEDLAAFVADPQEYVTVLFGGSGTAAVEAILSSAIGGDCVVIVNNGAYGKRMCQIAEVYGLRALEFHSAPDRPVDLDLLERQIAEAPGRVSHLAVVHSETTTGLLNDIRAIGELCRRHRIEMIVDAMSSYGAVPIRMQEMNIAFLAASANKNLQGMPGVSFVIARRDSLERLKPIKPRSFYLNLYGQYACFAETRQMRFTPPVQTLYALRQAIEELKREGIEARYARYCRSWETLVRGLRRLGLTHLVAEEHHSKIVTSIVEPDCGRYNFQEMHDYFSEKGFTIYPGKLENLPTFRVANIGDITCKDIEAFLRLLERYLKGIGWLPRKAEEK
jgi:2-aminoethylphosphonate-pyruvate transaminase